MMKLERTLYLLCLLTSVCALAGCIEEYEADISADDSHLLVVEGAICSSQLNRFVLTRTQPIGTYDVPQGVLNAKVSVRGTDGSEYVTQQVSDSQSQTGNGYYYCSLGALNPDVEYYLHIEADGEVYESEPQKPLPTGRIEDVHGVQNTPESSIDVLITTDAPLHPEEVSYYSWTYDETWEVRPEYKTILYYDTVTMEPAFKNGQFPERGWLDATGSTIMVGASTNYDDQHIRGLKLYDIPRDDSRVYYMYSGLVHQRAISKAEYEYELARLQAGSDMGGLFTPLPSVLPTNIHCLTSNKHVIGFIGCSLNTSDYRFSLNINEFSIRRPLGIDTRTWVINPSMEDCLKLVKRGMYLCEWLRPDQTEDHQLHTAWASIQQLDVRYKYKGAYIVMPDFWSGGEYDGEN